MTSKGKKGLRAGGYELTPTAASAKADNARMNTPNPTPEHDLPALPELAPGLYVHHKGGRYTVIGVARHSETHEALVVYRPLQGEGALWVRPFGMFTEDVVVDGVRQPRFRRVNDSPTAP